MRSALALTAALAAVAILAASAQASTLQGKFLQNCPASQKLVKDDAIVNPGQPGGADHWHTVMGGRMDAYSTSPTLLAGPTTCFIEGNHSAYWMPAIVAPDGSLVGATSFSSYYAAAWMNTNAIPGGKIQPPPFGLRMIAGNSKSTTTQSPDIVKFSCNRPGDPILLTIPTSCATGVGVRALINYPNCWDGVHLDTADHKSHVGYGITKYATDGTRLGTGCPDGWVPIPQVQAEFFFPPTAVGGMLDSDHGTGPAGRTMHADVMFAWQGQTISELLKCVNDTARNLPTSPLCGQFTSTTSPWLPPLIGWANKVTYVKPDGTPAPAPNV